MAEIPVKDEGLDVCLLIHLLREPYKTMVKESFQA